ncbi:MAG: nucleotidyltransferase family protein [archaeon]
MKYYIKTIKLKALPVLKKYNIARAGIFGSYARGDYKKNSDVDMLIEVKDGFSLLDLIGLEMELKKILKKKVDLLTYGCIHPLLKEKILNEEIRII